MGMVNSASKLIFLIFNYDFESLQLHFSHLFVLLTRFTKITVCNLHVVHVRVSSHSTLLREVLLLLNLLMSCVFCTKSYVRRKPIRRE
jgi:hypothetical protein